MSRSGYTEECDDQGELNLYRANVHRAIHGKRGQAFLQEMLDALDAIPDKRLLASVLVSEKGCCAMGAVAQKRGTDTTKVDADSPQQVGKFFNIAPAMAAEIAYINDDDLYDYYIYKKEETPEKRWARVRAWVVKQLPPRQEA